MEYNPTFIKQDPITGLVFYDFEGHIHATGIDITGGASGGLPPSSGISWLPDDNADEANAITYIRAGSNRDIARGPIPAWEQNDMLVRARTPLAYNNNLESDDSWPATLEVRTRTYDDGTNEAAVMVVAGNLRKTVLNGFGESDYALIGSYNDSPAMLAPWEPWGADPFTGAVYACGYQVTGKQVTVTALVYANGAAGLGQWIFYNLPSPRNQERTVHNCLAYDGTDQRICRVDVRYDTTWHGVLVYIDSNPDVEFLSMAFSYLID